MNLFIYLYIYFFLLNYKSVLFLTNNEGTFCPFVKRGSYCQISKVSFKLRVL